MSILSSLALFLRNHATELKITHAQRTVLYTLAFRIGHNQDTWIKQKTLAAECCMTERYLQMIIVQLRSKGLLNVSPHGRQNHYQLTLEHTNCSSSIIPDTRTVVRVNTRTVVRVTSADKSPESSAPRRLQADAKMPKEKEKVTIKNKDTEKVELPIVINQKDWDEFLEHRKHMKAPLSIQAQKRAITSLLNLNAAGQNIAAVIDQTIVNGWKGFFPVRGKMIQAQANPPSSRYTDYTGGYWNVKEREVERAKEYASRDQSRGVGVQSAQSYLTFGRSVD
jgi:DNA-binding MarR family transcriptional regulator